MLYLNSGQCSFVGEEGNLVSQYLSIAGLYKQRREACKVAEKRASIRVCEVPLRMLAEIECDGVHVAVGVWKRDNIIGGV